MRLGRGPTRVPGLHAEGTGPAAAGPLDPGAEKPPHACLACGVLGQPVGQEQIHPDTATRMAEGKDEMGSDEQGPKPAPFPRHCVAPDGNIALPQRPAHTAQDRQQAQKERDPQGQLDHKGHIAKDREVRQDHVFQQGLIEAKGRMLRLRPEPVGQPAKALPLGIDDPGGFLERRLQP
jgi:hypothetical protein